VVSDSVFGSGVGLAPSASETAAPSEAAARTLPALFRAHYPAVWRLLRRFGVHPAQVDDAAQEVFWVAARRFEDILPGREKAFLYGVALRVASNELRRAQASAEAAHVISDAESALCDVAPSPEESLEQRRALALLDTALARLPIELRSVLVLFELEGLEVSKIAEIEGIPLGTASSRLRRARAEFAAIAKRLRASLTDNGGAG
jgi:RNA polymerase sigma-70 factor, ECF subfamily